MRARPRHPSFSTQVVCSDPMTGVQEVAEDGGGGGSLGDAGAADVWGAHLCEHLVQPLQGTIEVQLNPAGGAGHCLSPGRDTQPVQTQSKIMSMCAFVYDSERNR